MTNYKGYLYGGPSKQDLKLKRTLAYGDGKKIVKALSKMHGAEDICTQIPHLEGEEVFSSTKIKFDLSIGPKGDYHRHNKVNFFHPRVQTRYANTKCNLKLLLRSSTMSCPMSKL